MLSTIVPHIIVGDTRFSLGQVKSIFAFAIVVLSPLPSVSVFKLQGQMTNTSPQ